MERKTFRKGRKNYEKNICYEKYPDSRADGGASHCLRGIEGGSHEK